MTLEIVCLGIGLLVSIFVAMRASSHAREAHALADSALSYQKRLSVLPREELTALVKDTVAKAIDERERLKPEGTGIAAEVDTTREVNGFKAGDRVVVTGKVVGFIESYGRFAACVQVEPTTPQMLKHEGSE